jgi:RecA/RadA recombinase
MKLNYLKLLDKIGNDMNIVPVHLSRESMVGDAISTGSLVADLIIGGGWPTGRWVALFGMEASCKSTLLYHTLGNAIKQNVNAEFFDFEGSTDPSYLKKILNIDLSNIFGLRKEGGTWEIAPQCRYHQPDLGEPIFRYMHRILKILPDKVQNAGQWFYVYDKKPKESYDVKLYKNTGRFWVPAEDGALQVIWFIDSLPAMLTEKQDEKDETNEIGLQARMFSKNIPLIKSRLARKRCSVVAVNQIRMKPMAFGNPEYEPCGEAPRFYSDIRLQCRSCSNPFAKGQIEEEACWDSIGIDRYRYIKICTRKNKCFSPFRESLMRIWMEEKGDTGRGLDPVFDTFQYLKETGQIVEEGRGTKKVYRLTIPGIWTQHVWTYKEFKELILNPNRTEVYIKFRLNDPTIGKIENANVDLCKTILDLREACKQQIKTSAAFDLYFKTICNGGSAPEISKSCGMCVHFHKLENCMEVKEGQEGCEDWSSEEEQEEETELPPVPVEEELEEI